MLQCFTVMCSESMFLRWKNTFLCDRSDLGLKQKGKMKPKMQNSDDDADIHIQLTISSLMKEHFGSHSHQCCMPFF